LLLKFEQPPAHCLRHWSL